MKPLKIVIVVYVLLHCNCLYIVRIHFTKIIFIILKFFENSVIIFIYCCEGNVQ